VFKGVQARQVEGVVVGVVERLVPLAHGLDVDGANAPVSAPAELGDQVTADESTGARDQDQIVRFHDSPLLAAHR
jgi:hypothetical protein